MVDESVPSRLPSGVQAQCTGDPIHVSFSNAPGRAGFWFGSERRAINTSDHTKRHLVPSFVASARDLAVGQIGRGLLRGGPSSPGVREPNVQYLRMAYRAVVYDRGA